MLPGSRVVALLLVALLIGLPTAAFADPPDPSWISGYWDDDDFDDVVIAIAAAFAITAPAHGAEMPLWAPIARVERPTQEAWRALLRAAAPPRAPPVNASTYC